MAHDVPSHDPELDSHAHDAHGGTGKYWAVFFALLILTGASFMTFFPFWHESIPVPVSRAFMMAVSVTKALLVMAFFMHLIWEANWKYVLTIPAAMMSVFLIFMLVPDIGCRYPHYSEQRLIFAPDPHTAEAPHGPHAAHTDGTHVEGDHASEDRDIGGGH